MSERNIAFAKTLPDVTRDSNVTIRAGNHPVSDDLKRCAESVSNLGKEVLDALHAESALIARTIDVLAVHHPEVAALRTLPGTLRMLEARLRVISANARIQEDFALQRMKEDRE